MDRMAGRQRPWQIICGEGKELGGWMDLGESSRKSSLDAEVPWGAQSTVHTETPRDTSGNLRQCEDMGWAVSGELTSPGVLMAVNKATGSG